MNLTYNIEKNHFVYKFYDLTPEEIPIVKGFNKGKCDWSEIVNRK